MPKNHFAKILFPALFLLFALVNSAAFAKSKSHAKNKIAAIENSENQIVNKGNPFVIIEGSERVDDQTILSFLDNPHATSFSQKDIDSFLKKLYESDLFFDAKITHQGSKILVKLQENPVVSDIKFVGNKKINDESLQGEISLKKRTIFSKSKLQSDLKRINEIYLKSGRFLTKIDPKIIQKEQNRVEVIFDIYEGKKAKIGNIYLVGNNEFSDQELFDEISTKKSKWWKFLSSSDVYDSDRVEFDKEKLRRFYGSKGFADFAAISSIAQISPEKDQFFITFLIEEGVKYRLGEVNIVNQVRKFDESLLKKAVLVKSGKVFNSELVEKTVDSMVEIMSDKSYAFASVEPVLRRDKERKIIDVDFVLNETPRIYIDQIHITGNVRTLDEVIRRELRLREGDGYNVTKINRSKQRIQNLGFFDKVEFKTKRVGNTDKVDIEIEVKEKKTGELNLGVGYSTVGGATANIGVKEKNLFGTGRELGINFQQSANRFSSEINYTKPFFLDRPIDVGFDLADYRFSKLNTLVYDQKSDSVTLRADYNASEFLHHQMRYSFRQETVSNVDPSASQNIINLQGSYTNSTIGQSFVYDKRDNRINPTSGYYFSISQDYTGLGGNMKNIKHEGSAGYYIPTFTDEYILKFLVKGGIIEGIGQGVRSNDGFFLGGNSFRGFQFSGIGPRSIVNGTAVGGNVIGGKIYYLGTAEFRFPLGLPKELGISGVLFSDNGTVKGVDARSKVGNPVADIGSLRSTYGLSIMWSSPLGPIRLDFSQILRKENYDNVQRFLFNFGTSF